MHCHRARTHRRTAASFCLCLFPRQDRLHGVAGLGNVGQVEGRPGLYRRLAGNRAAALAAEIAAHLLSLVGFNRAGVRLWLSHANRSQSVQNGPALDFEFPCQIVDSNFAHPSLFVSPAPLAVHISLIEGQI
jgi:hypothetical protein